jgi:hypothetical protein
MVDDRFYQLDLTGSNISGTKISSNFSGLAPCTPKRRYRIKFENSIKII